MRRVTTVVPWPGWLLDIERAAQVVGTLAHGLQADPGFYQSL